MPMSALQGIFILFLVLVSSVAAQNATTSTPMGNVTTGAPVVQVNVTTAAPVAQVNVTSAPMPMNTTKAPGVERTTAPIITKVSSTTTKPKPRTSGNISETSTSPMPSSMSTTKMTTTPTPTPTPDPSRFTSIDTEIQIVGLSEKEIEDILNKTSAARKDFEKKLEKTIRKLFKDKEVAAFIIRSIRRGSIIVQYTIVLNGSSPKQVQQAIKIINDQIKTGKVGDFTVNKEHSTSTKITVTADKFKACEQPKDESEKTDKNLLILLSVAVGVLGLLVIVLIVLTCALYQKRKVHDIAKDDS